MVSIIVAYSKNRVIGQHGNVPWNLPTDKARFAKITDGAAVIMGRKTYESIIDNDNGPLINRRNIVVSHTQNTFVEGFEIVDSLQKALLITNATSPDDEVFIIGGGQLYDYCLKHDIADQMYLTEVDEVVEGDAFFPNFDESKWLEISKKSIPKDDVNQSLSTFRVLVKINHETEAIELVNSN